MPINSRFVCVINRNRDDFQVPLALHEAGLLERLVTDFYVSRRTLRWLPPILRRRRIDGLPSSLVSPVAVSFALQALAKLFRMPMSRVIARVNRLHADRTARLARERRCHAYCYANYVPEREELPPEARTIVFEFHPHPLLTRDLLRTDAAGYPEVSGSYAEELAALDRASINSAWQRADAIVCASSMTRRSLEHAGCPAERITVVPYGFVPDAAPVRERTEDQVEILFVGQGIQRKGLHHLIRAWQAAPPASARLTLVCYRIDPGIAALIEHPSIRLLGYQDRPRLRELYATSDVFAMPSLVEGFGLVYLEAIAAGCHVLGTTNTGLPDLDLPPEAATIVPPGDLTALSQALHEVVDMKRRGRLDPWAIADQATRRPWKLFRRDIAAHARTFLEQSRS